MSGLRTWLVLVTLLACVETGWALATPLYAGADEPVQVIKAAAVLRGEWRGAPSSAHGAQTTVVVPQAFSDDIYAPFCFLFRPERSASCMGPFPRPGFDPERLVAASTYVGRYPPLYYLLVGAPSRWSTSAGAIYAMRAISGLLSAMAVALALVMARGASGTGVRRSSLPVLGVLIAVTPSVLFNGAVVNPNGLEISASVALWACLLRMMEDHETPSPSLVACTAVAACVTVAMRGLSPLWVAITVVTALLFGGARRMRELARIRRVKVALVVTGLVVAASIAWIVLEGSLDLMGVSCGAHCSSTWSTLSRLLTMTGNYLYQLIGVFGWVTTGSVSTAADTTAPFFTVVLWAVALGALVILGARRNRVPAGTRTASGGRPRTALALSAGVCFLLPLVIQMVEARSIGLVWQGRYILPLAVGIPIMAGFAARELRVDFRVGTLVGAGLLVAQAGALWWFLRRFAVGSRGPLWFPPHAAWSPPLPALALAAVTTGALGASYWWSSRAL